MRSITHHIDPIPRSSLSNKTPHKMIPIENEELDREVQQLLEREMTRESLSPCATLVVLASNKGDEWRMCTN